MVHSGIHTYLLGYSTKATTAAELLSQLVALKKSKKKYIQRKELKRDVHEEQRIFFFCSYSLAPYLFVNAQTWNAAFRTTKASMQHTAKGAVVTRC